MDVDETEVGLVFGGLKAGERLLGPTLDYLGLKFRDWTRAGVENIEATLKNAISKAGDLDDETQSISPRAAWPILEESLWASDEVMVEYLGGLLAASRSPGGSDDTGVVWAKRISAMSTYSLRLHYGLYQAASGALEGVRVNLGFLTEARSKGKLWLPMQDVLEVLLVPEDEDRMAILRHAVDVLIQEGLIDSQSYAYGPATEMRSLAKLSWTPSVQGFVFVPTPRGVELFLVAHGIRGESFGRFLRGGIEPLDVSLPRLVARTAQELGALTEEERAKVDAMYTETR